jgi:predicted nucleotidyltransferase
VTDDVQVVREFTSELADALGRVAEDALVGVYLHGSAVLGDWSAPASDVDVLVVVEDGVTSSTARRLVEILRSGGKCPGAGLEASIVEAGAASAPAAPWPFVVHATTTHDDGKVVWGAPGAGDDDLILHYAVARSNGWAAYGPDPRLVVGPVPDGVVATQLAHELHWAVEHAGASYAILNACRALHFRDTGLLSSKTDGGHWARARGIQPELVQAALADRRAGVSLPITKAAAEWVLAVAAEVSRR